MVDIVGGVLIVKQLRESQMEKRELEVGDVVQLTPDVENKMFAGCFLTVTEPKPWGCQGYVQALGEDGKPGGQAYLRPTWERMEFVGTAAFIVSSF